MALEEIWLDGGVAAALDAAALSESLYLYYRDALGIVIARVEDQIGLGTVPDWRVEGFRPFVGETCAYVERTGWSDHGRLVEFSRTWFDNEKSRYVSRLGKGV